jgi:cobalt-zinc-cadmium efflux system protein
MSHDHHHHQPFVLTNVSKAFYIGIVLNLLFVLIQAGVGLHIRSLSLCYQMPVTILPMLPAWYYR